MGDDSYHASYPDSTATPLLDDISLPDVEDDKGKRVDEGQHEYRPGHPIVPDVEFLVGDTGERSNGVGFCAENTVIWLDMAKAMLEVCIREIVAFIHQERHASQSHVACSRSNGWRIAVGYLLSIGPVVWTLS